MQKIKQSFNKVQLNLKRSLDEVIASVGLFIGLPVSALLYFDIRAAILALSLALVSVGVLAMRAK